MRKFSVYQHWDPLRLCVVGRSYPPEFYNWITVPHVRSLFETMAQETEEDYQAIIKKLTELEVEVIRPHLPQKTMIGGRYLPPPMTPRDYMVMIGDRFYKGYQLNLPRFYADIKDPTWPNVTDDQQFWNLPRHILDECQDVHDLDAYIKFYSSYDHVFDRIAAQGNEIRSPMDKILRHITNGAYVTRVGRDLYFGTPVGITDVEQCRRQVKQEFPQYRTHVIATGGHSDGVYCPVCPGLIISLRDIPTYKETFPGWEVVYLPPGESWAKVKPFLELKAKNNGKWWIPGFEHDQAVIDTVEQWLGHWTGYVEETVFDIKLNLARTWPSSMLIVNPKNVMVFNYNKQIFDALERYGITPHIVPFRHRLFWDGGIYCITMDVDRLGSMQDYFPERQT